jgi:formylmethanofuran dehydrogenase subunit E
MCFADGIQYTTGCTFGKGNIAKTGDGKLAVTLIDKATGRQVRVAYRPTLQPRIRQSAFMAKRMAGVPATDIPDAEQWELVNLVWDAEPDQVMTIGAVGTVEWSEPEEVVRFAVCPQMRGAGGRAVPSRRPRHGHVPALRRRPRLNRRGARWPTWWPAAWCSWARG